MNKIEDVINFYLSKSEMSPKKLQKILYYAYSWHLTLMNENKDELSNRLFGERFEAWVHGPVIREVYDMYRGNGYQSIKRYTKKPPSFDEDTNDILNQVWEVYGEYNGNQLESISHQESPWINARDGCQPLDRCDVEISDEDIFECYVQRIQ